MLEHEREIRNINEKTEALREMNRKIPSKKIQQKKLIDMGQELRISLSDENIKQIFYDNLEHFNDIRNGKVKTWRSKWYNNGNEDSLQGSLLSGPFSDIQQDVIYEEVRKNFLKDGIPSRFVDLVLIPEVYIRIYQVFFNLTKKEAEQNLKEQHIYNDTSGSESSINGMYIK